MSDPRLTRLEEALTHQADMLEDLSQMLIAQGKTIERLERNVALLRARAAEAEADSGGGTVILADQKPPHY
ncbi:SlyX family protein [Oceanibium sediminis]|uniref:SlyX family protein n=1 Tax=Oceanibium sediminis TaxID=2026339 RepID=UPI000DD4D814|nr:SlyX family protein [Oceanibium sediminis]